MHIHLVFHVQKYKKKKKRLKVTVTRPTEKKHVQLHQKGNWESNWFKNYYFYYRLSSLGEIHSVHWSWLEEYRGGRATVTSKITRTQVGRCPGLWIWNGEQGWKCSRWTPFTIDARHPAAKARVQKGSERLAFQLVKVSKHTLKKVQTLGHRQIIRGGKKKTKKSL